MELDITQLLSSDVLFAHLIDETLAFHHELHSVYSYPALLHSCLHVLIQTEPFHKWKTIEKKCKRNKLEACCVKSAEFRNPVMLVRVPIARGVRLAKNDLASVFGSVLQKNCGFWFCFGFTKLTVVLVFSVRFLHYVV